MSPSFWSSSSNHHLGREGIGSLSHHGGRGGRGSSSHHDGRRGRSAVTEMNPKEKKV